MKTLFAGLCSVLLISAIGHAADVPASPSPDQAASDALRGIEEMIERGEVGWWKSEADPSIQFLNKYSGLGGDAVTALSLNQAEQLWPAWKTVGNGLERFGIACSVYNCLKSANEGNYNAAALNALKDFVKYRLSKMGDTLAASAAGVGLIDFALNSFGEAAMQQISDDYWFFYCRYQTQRHPGLASYIRLIKDGDGTRRGFEAVVASLDSFWEDPETHGIRGFSTLKTQDPNYQATFRSRYLKENLLPFLQNWAEREREKEQIAAYVALQRLTEQLQNTTVAVDFALLDKGLNEPPAGAMVDVVAQFYGAQPETRVLAKAPIATRNRLEFKLASAMGPDHRLPTALKVRLHRAGATSEPRNTGEVFELALNNPSGPWRRDTKAGMLAYVAKHPLFTTDWSECTVTMTGPGADKIYSGRFMRVPTATAENLRELASAPGGSGVGLQNGQGKVRLSHGYYLFVSDVEQYVFTHGPVKIAGPMALSIPVQPAVERSAPAPDLAGYRAAVARAAEVVKQREPTRRETFAAAGEALQAYWVSAYTALNSYLSTARALQQKMHSELAQPNLTPDQQRAIMAKYGVRAAEMEKAITDAERAMQAATREEEQQVSTIDQEARQRYDAIRRDYSGTTERLHSAISDVQQKIYPLSSAFEKLSFRVTSGTLASVPADTLEQELTTMRTALQQLEAGLPALLEASARLPAVQEDCQRAVAAIHEVALNEGEVIYFNPGSRDAEIATIQAQVEGLKNGDIVAKARALLQQGERLVEARRDRARRAGAMRRELEAIAAEFPAVDAAAWAAQSGEFRTRADALFAVAMADEGADDTAQFAQLQGDLQAFFATQLPVCGDLLAVPARTATAFSRFNEAFREFSEQQLNREMPSDFWQQMDQLAWSKLRARHQAVGEALAIAADVRRWLAAGADRAARTQRLAALQGEFTGPAPARDMAAQIEQLNRLMARFDELPARLVQRERQAWEAARTRLARSGELDNWLRSQPRPVVKFAKFADAEVDRFVYWPEKAEKNTPQTQHGLTVCLTVTNVPDDATYMIQESSDGGRHWRSLNYYRGQWRTQLPWQPREYRFRAVLPGGEETLELAAFPQYVGPTG